MNFKEVRENVINTVSEKSPEILVGIGLAGMLTSTVLAVKATPKALDIIAEAEEYSEYGELTNLEKIKKTWRCYVPAALGYIASASCIIASNTTNKKRNVVLAGAYKATESALIEYRNKVAEVIGDEKEKEIRESVIKDREESGKPIITCLGKDEYLCYDELSGRYFKSDIDRIKKVVNDMNYKLLNDNILSLNEFYFELGLKPVDAGYTQGWDISKGMIEVSFTSGLSEDDIPCLVMEFDNKPQQNFDRFL